MKPCTETRHVQDYLDGDLPPAAEAAFRAHLSTCAACALDVSLYRRVMDSIARAATWDPGPELTERVLDRILPVRVRRRWLRRLWTGYAAAFAATVGAITALVAQPSFRDAAVVVASASCRELVQGLALALHGLGVVVAGLATGWGLIEAAGRWLSPLGRAVSALLGNSGIALPCAIAAIACVMLLWWMRSRDSRIAREAPHVVLLGF